MGYRSQLSKVLFSIPGHVKENSQGKTETQTMLEQMAFSDDIL